MEALPAEASCPVCLEVLREPVSIHCGHHFCRPCIERCWEWPTAAFACPRCRDTAPRRSLRPSPELARLLELARRLSRGQEEEEEEEEEEEGCQKHREPLEVFCKEDAALLCAICRESRAHRAHTVVPVPEAVRECREQIQAGLQTLKDAREKLLERREAEMRRSWQCLEETGAERRRVLAQFQGLRLSLEELCCRLLARLGDLESDVGRAQEDTVTVLTEEISRLDSRVQELEEKCQQPARTFLQDITGTLGSLGKENLELPPTPLPELERKILGFREDYLLLEETLRSFQDILAFELPEKMTVTLDPSTAHPQLLVAPDGSSVSWERPRDPPGDGDGAGTDPAADGTGPGTDPSVLGREGVTAGRRCWDVQVSPEGSWALGVARETPGSGAGIPGIEEGTPGRTPGSPEWELWSMGLCQGQFWALTSLERIPLFPARAPGRVRVALDYESGRVAFFDAERRAAGVAFFDAERRSLIFAFRPASFEGQSVRPWFLVWGEGSRLALCP
ncbi:E3 ubiquitin-protein ligase TRIM7-like [Prinia subflava]|uniref:E3 ubiquitin-protein ligase TRIM7-like n=1 Tax=Prinia subflava TaxID=208062 RepID=UPI002FE30C11